MANRWGTIDTSHLTPPIAQWLLDNVRREIQCGEEEIERRKKELNHWKTLLERLTDWITKNPSSPARSPARTPISPVTKPHRSTPSLSATRISLPAPPTIITINTESTDNPSPANHLHPNHSHHQRRNSSPVPLPLRHLVLERPSMARPHNSAQRSKASGKKTFQNKWSQLKDKVKKIVKKESGMNDLLQNTAGAVPPSGSSISTASISSANVKKVVSLPPKQPSANSGFSSSPNSPFTALKTLTVSNSSNDAGPITPPGGASSESNSGVPPPVPTRASAGSTSSTAPSNAANRGPVRFPPPLSGSSTTPTTGSTPSSPAISPTNSSSDTNGSSSSTTGGLKGGVMQRWREAVKAGQIPQSNSSNNLKEANDNPPPPPPRPRAMGRSAAEENPPTLASSFTNTSSPSTSYLGRNFSTSDADFSESSAFDSVKLRPSSVPASSSILGTSPPNTNGLTGVAALIAKNNAIAKSPKAAPEQPTRRVSIVAGKRANPPAPPPLSSANSNRPASASITTGPPPRPIPSLPQQQYVRAVYSYQDDDPDYVSFDEGAIGILLNNSAKGGDAEWWKIRLIDTGVEGLAPSNFMEKLDPNDSRIPK